jgi:peptidoglycan/LPS O-acetylase OafA/YrhL
MAGKPARGTEARLAGVDSIRFWLAIWVYLSHFAPVFHVGAGAGFLLQALSGVLNNLFNGAAAVMGFFLVSGLCIHYPYRDNAVISLPQFYIRRYVRILIPFLAAIAFAYCSGLDLAGFYASILWSLVAELIYYTLYPAFRWVIRVLGLRSLMAASFAASGTIVVSHPGYLNFHQFGPGLTWLVGLPAWLLGCCLAENSRSRRAQSDGEIRSLSIWFWRLSVWALASLASVLRFHVGIGYPVSLTLLAPVLYFWLKTELAWHRQKGVSRLFERFGQFSYSIYLMHGLAVTAATFLLPFTAFAAFAPLRLALVMALSYGFFIAVERPAHRIARRLASLVPAERQRC